MNEKTYTWTAPTGIQVYSCVPQDTRLITRIWENPVGHVILSWGLWSRKLFKW